MTSALQNRLVGTIIVVALVVILLPEFLDGEKRINTQEFVNIPNANSSVELEQVEPLDTTLIAQEVAPPVEVVNERALDDIDNNNAENTSPTGNQNQSPDVSETNNTETNTAEQNNSTSEVSTQTQESSSEQSNVPSASNNNNASTADSQSTLAGEEADASAWVVQLGSFRHKKNVDELIETLRQAGFQANSRPIMTSMGQLNKVYVGPSLNKKELEQALPKLEQLTKLKGKITAFEVSAN